MSDDPMYRALLSLSDTLDADEGPVILAWAVDRLAAALTKALADRGFELTDKDPVRSVSITATSLHLAARPTEDPT